MSNKKTLVLFSGGRDSVYLTYKLLADTSDDVTLVVLLKGGGIDEHILSSGVNYYDLPAVIEPMIELQKYRKFNVIVHTPRKEQVQSFVNDHWHNYGINLFAQDLNEGKYDRIASGVTYEQDDAYIYGSRTAKEYQGMLRCRIEHNHTPNIVDKSKIWQPLLTHDIHENFTRWHVLKYMPEHLSESIDTKRPESKTVCDNTVRRLIAKGWNADDFDNWRKEKNREYGGGNRDMDILYWIYLENEQPLFQKEGVALPNRNPAPRKITTKQQGIEWYDTVEFNPPLDHTLVQWNLTKEAEYELLRGKE